MRLVTMTSWKYTAEFRSRLLVDRLRKYSKIRRICSDRDGRRYLRLIGRIGRCLETTTVSLVKLETYKLRSSILLIRLTVLLNSSL